MSFIFFVFIYNIYMSSFDNKYDLVTYYIDSCKRTSGTSWDFYYNIGNLPDSCNACMVSNVQLPKWYYLINEYNNKFNVEYDSTFFTVNLVKGEYNDDQFFAMVRTQFNAELTGYSNDVDIFKNNSEFDEADVLRRKPEYNFSGSASSTIFKFSELPENWNINYLMGFDRKDYESVTGLSGQSIYAPNIYNLCHINDKLYLNASFVSENGGTDSTTVLRDIYMHNISFGNCAIFKYDFTRDNYKKINNATTIKTPRFFLTDEYDNVVDLNGVNFSFTLHFFKKL